MARRWLILLLPLIIAILSTLALQHTFASHPSESLNFPTTTDLGGPLPGDTTLRPADNPHIVNDHLIVPAGVTLTVEPGVELRFAPGASLIVYGRLLAEGTPTQTIHFTHRDDGAYWGAIAILDSPADNRISHALIEYTREGLSSPRSHGVTAYNSRLTLADSTLRYTQNSAGITAYEGSTLYLLRNEIHDTQGDAVHPTGGVAVIQDNHIYNARWGAYYYEGIEISKMSPDAPAWVVGNHIHDVSDDCLDINDSWVIVARNRLHHCADKGISIGSGGSISPGSQAPSATLVNNLVYASEIGIAIKDNTRARIVHNTVADSETGLALYEAHDHGGFGGGRATVINTILWGNSQTISLDALSVLTVTFSIVEGHWPGEGNLAADPLLQTADDYRLGAGSPAVNAGRDEGLGVDLDGEPRPVGHAPDMGAHERQSLLDLWGRPGDERIYLRWQSSINDTALTNFVISATARLGGRTALPPIRIAGLPTTTLAYTLTSLDNYAWYTVVVEGWGAGDEMLARSNRVAVMPTDRYVYLPVIVRRDS